MIAWLAAKLGSKLLPWGLFAAAAAGAVLMGKLWLGAMADVATSEALRAADLAQFESSINSQKEVITDLRLQRKEDQRALLAMSDVVTKIRASADAERARLEKFRKGLAARTIKKPEVTRRGARAALRRAACQRWKATGGEGACPKTDF